MGKGMHVLLCVDKLEEHCTRLDSRSRSWFLVLKNGPLREVLFGKVEQNGIFSVASHLASVVHQLKHPTFKLECFGIGNWLG